VLEFGTAGLAIWTFLGAAQMYVWASQGGDTPEKKRKRETGVILPSGGVLHGKKIISLAEAERRGLKLEYPERPKKKANFWKGR
jgi:hypothetical protein